MHTAVPAIPRPRQPLEPHHPPAASTPGRHRRRPEVLSRGDLALNSAAAVGRIVTILALVVFAAAAVATTAPAGPESASTFVSGDGR